jgi:ABC-type lipoprotein release transport system permease subunit
MGIGIVGVVFGTVLGLGLNEIMDKTHLVQLPPDIYQIAFLPVVFRWSEIGWIAVFAFLICVCAAIYPAVQVVRKSPLEGIRNE